MITQLMKINKHGILILVLSLVLLFGCASLAFADDDSDVLPFSTEAPSQVSDVSVTVLRVSANDTSGLHSIVLGLLGDYNPVVKDYTYQSSNGYYQHSIDIQPDWSWIATAALFIIVIYSVFRFLGSLVSGGHI